MLQTRLVGEFNHRQVDKVSYVLLLLKLFVALGVLLVFMVHVLDSRLGM